MTGRDRALAVGLCLVAFALRAGDLAGQSLWSDEDITLDRSTMALRALWRDLPVEHGIGYFALQRGWTRLAGDGDVALRFPSALAGTIIVALLLVLGRRLVGHRAAWFAACAAATSPFLVSYGQEARMYALLAALGVGALAAAERARPARLAPWLATGALAALAIHTHAFGVLVVAIVAVLAVGDVAGRWRPPATGLAAGAGAERRTAGRGWALAVVALTAPLLPVVPRLAALTGARGSLLDRDWLVAGGGNDGGNPLLALGRLIGAWTAQTVVTATRPLAPIELLAAILVGLAASAGTIVLARVALRRDVAGRRATLALAWLVVPPMAGAALTAMGATVHPRYLILGVPALLLAAGVGIGRLPGRAALVAGAGVIAVAALPLARWYGDPAAQKRDYLALVATADATTDGRDTVLLLDGPSMGLSKRYLPPESPLKLENLRSETNDGREPRAFEARLAALVHRRTNVWLATDGAAATSARDWLAGNLYAMGATGVQDVTLRRYASAGAAGDLAVPLTAPVGCLSPEPFGWTTSNSASHGIGGGRTTVVCLESGLAAPRAPSAGDVIRIELRWLVGRGWAASAAAAEEHRVSVRLVDATGEAVASLDGRPVDWTQPTTSWQPNDVVRDRYALAIPANLPAGRYAFEATLYDEATLVPLVPLVQLGEEVEIAAPSSRP